MASKLLSNLKLKNVSLYDESSDDDDDDYDVDNKKNVDFYISLEKLSLGPKKKLLVLSLGGLLVHRQHNRDKATHIPPTIHPDIRHGNFCVYKRPFCDEFLKFCFERFEVALWSSAREHNAHFLLSQLVRGYENKFMFVWDQDKCTDTGFKSLEKKHKPIFLKELHKVWDEYPQYSSANTLLIDDEPHKALLNPPNTAIFNDKYIVSDLSDDYLGPNGGLQAFLDGLVEAADVPSYVEDNPFGQSAITPTHSNWSYYSKIVRKFGKGVADQKIVPKFGKGVADQK